MENEQLIKDVTDWAVAELLTKISNSNTVCGYEEMLLEQHLDNPEFIRGYLRAIKDITSGGYFLMHPSLYQSS